MKRIATLVNDAGHCVGLVHGPEFVNQSISVGGRVWRFNFDKWFGPLWLKADGYTERKNQNPPKAVWRAFNRWYYRTMRKEVEHD